MGFLSATPGLTVTYKEGNIIITTKETSPPATAPSPPSPCSPTITSYEVIVVSYFEAKKKQNDKKDVLPKHRLFLQIVVIGDRTYLSLFDEVEEMATGDYEIELIQNADDATALKLEKLILL